MQVSKKWCDDFVSRPCFSSQPVLKTSKWCCGASEFVTTVVGVVGSSPVRLLLVSEVADTIMGVSSSSAGCCEAGVYGLQLLQAAAGQMPGLCQSQVFDLLADLEGPD